MTRVIFRKFEDEVTAIFPDVLWNNNGDLASYAHIGQHGACTRDYASISTPCQTEEYQELLAELKSIGYDDLKVIKKR